MPVGFIGLGNLGKTMAGRLLSENTDLVVWNRSKSRAEGMNAPTAKNPAELITMSEIVILSLSDSNAVQAVLESEGGLLQGDCKGKIVIDTTTNHFETVVTFHRQIFEHGGTYLEAPVLGSVIPAVQGNLTVLVSGDRKSFDTAYPLLEKIGRRIFFLEKPGLATRMKLVNNLVLGAFMTTLAEALVIAEEAGMNRELVLDILESGAGNSTILTGKRQKLLEEDYTPHFSMAMIYKDLGYLEDLAKSLGKTPFTAIVSRELFGKAIPLQMENLDFSGVYKILKGL